MKFKQHFENQLKTISLFALNEKNLLKNHFQESLCFAYLLNYIAKPIFKQN